MFEQLKYRKVELKFKPFAIFYVKYLDIQFEVPNYFYIDKDKLCLQTKIY